MQYLVSQSIFCPSTPGNIRDQADHADDIPFRIKSGGILGLDDTIVIVVDGLANRFSCERALECITKLGNIPVEFESGVSNDETRLSVCVRPDALLGGYNHSIGIGRV